MSEKEEALQHLSAIKSVLVDKDSFFPYNYTAIMIWGVIGMVLTLLMLPLLHYSLLLGTLFSLSLFALGFIVEGFLTKKVNDAYDIEDCTRRQRFIMMMFLAVTLFGVVMTALLAKGGLYYPIYAMWMFLCGLGHYSVGFVLNMKIFKISSTIEIVLALLMLIVMLFLDDLAILESNWHYLFQGMTFLFLGVMPIMIGRKLKEK